MNRSALFLTAIGVLAVMTFTTTPQPRGIRNNNPGNIRATGDQWQGMTGADAAGFVQFAAPVYGVRAMARILTSYARQGHVTVRQIITRWAPPTENDTDSYVTHAADALGLSADAPVTERHWPDLIAVMIQHENGQQPYAEALIREGVQIA